MLHKSYVAYVGPVDIKKLIKANIAFFRVHMLDLNNIEHTLN